MIAFDANILVRHFVDDDPEQAELVDQAFVKAIGSGEEIFVSQVVIAEVVWVLSSRYKYRKEEIAYAMRQLLQVDNVEVEEPEMLSRALNAYESGRGGLIDYLIAERATAAGCERILTFDEKLWPDPRFVAPGRWAK